MFWRLFLGLGIISTPGALAAITLHDEGYAGRWWQANRTCSELHNGLLPETGVSDNFTAAVPTAGDRDALGVACRGDGCWAAGDRAETTLDPTVMYHAAVRWVGAGEAGQWVKFTAHGGRQALRIVCLKDV
jgi:hypothetical protein